MKFEFDSTNPREVEALSAALAVLSGTPEVKKTPPPSMFDSSPDGPAEVADEAGSAPAPSSQEASPAAVDTNGVPFNDNYCGQATDPFYSSGKQAGQWKKKRGVDESDYQNWYSSELAKLKPAEPAPTDTSAAFAPPPPPAEDPAPRDTGEFMVWTSTQTAAGKITQDQINAAYQATGVTMADLFAPDPSAAISKMYAELSRVIAA